MQNSEQPQAREHTQAGRIANGGGGGCDGGGGGGGNQSSSRKHRPSLSIKPTSRGSSSSKLDLLPQHDTPRDMHVCIRLSVS